MPARRALVVSAVVHAVVVAVAAGRAIDISVMAPHPRLRTPVMTPIEVVPVTPPDDMVVSLVVLPEPIATAPPEPAPEPAALERSPRARVATTQRLASAGALVSTGTATEPGTTEPGKPTGASKLRMRGHDLSLSARATADFLASSKPLADDVRISGKLEGHGREHVAHDLVTTMTVHEDGTATFKDNPDSEIHLALPIRSRKELGDLLERWSRDPYAQTKARSFQELPKHEQAVPGGWDAGAGGDGAPDGSETTPSKPSSGGGIGILGGTFDLTAMAMRRFGMDPYASRKLKLLDDTRDERVAIGTAHIAKQLGRSSELMQRNVERLWGATLDPGQRRDALFALWDECDEGEQVRGEAGARARAIVIGWIRARIPAGSAAAFTPDEIAALDHKRTSRQHFIPY